MPLAYEQNFQAQADRQRRRMRRFLQLVAGAVILMGAALLAPDRWSAWLAIPGGTLVVTGLISYLTAPGLRCPRCAKSAENFDRYCPVCGSDGLRRFQITAAKCDGCQRTLGSNKGRNYTIHFCTHCGELLDGRGR